MKSINSVIRLEYKDIVRIKELLGEDKIIAAIKHCRSNGHHFVDGVKQFAEGSNQKRVSLKAAKHAIDVFRGRPPQGTPEAIIAPVLVIKSIRVETLEGEFEVDLDELQLRLLNGLDTLPLSVMSHSTQLITYLRDWQNLDSSGV